MDRPGLTIYVEKNYIHTLVHEVFQNLQTKFEKGSESIENSFTEKLMEFSLFGGIVEKFMELGLFEGIGDSSMI